MVLDSKITQLKPIPNAPGYYAGSDGLIYSTLKRNGWRPSIVDGRPASALKQMVLSTSGYYMVNLHIGEKQTSRLVHELILTAFCGDRPPKMVCCHGNGNRKDNRPENLRWDTRQSNEIDKEAHGTKIYGEKHHQAKINEETVRKVRLASGRHADIALCFGISKTQVGNIKAGRQWKRCV